jgi:hypothetical protein
MKKFFRRLYLKWEHEWRYLPRTIKNFITRLWYWIPILWDNEDWDYNQFYVIMRAKLIRMADYHEKSNRYVGVEYNVQRMRLCCRLLDKIIKGDYSSECQKYYECDYDWKPIPNSKYFTMKSDMVEDHIDEYIKKYPIIAKQALKTYPGKLDLTKDDDRKMFCHYMSTLRAQKAKKLVFKIIERDIEKWWD